MQKGNISVQTENIFPIIKKFLYSDQEIFLRELISNAVDATSKLRTLALKGEVKGDINDTTIEVIIDKDAKTLTISDRGIGLTEDEAKKYLNQVAFSSAQEFLEKYQNESSIIGHFGLGFYSAFMVADKVEAISKSYQEGSQGMTWTCEGDPEYTIDSNDKTERGTDIVLHVSEDATEFLEDSRIEGLLNKYCKFLPVPIKFGTRKETIKEGEGEDAEDKEIEVDNIINNPNPLWKKQPADLSDEDYQNFYRELYPFSQSPMFWIHLNIDYPFNLTGVLYFPKLNNSFELQKNKIQLYSNQVYVTDEVKEIVPEFLTLLHGVIDSPDIPLNVSRSYLQSDQNVKKITGYITKKVADKLNDLFKEDRKVFEEKWSDLGTFVKYGMISDDKFYDKGSNFVLLKNTAGEFFTIDEYKEKIKDTQTDKHNKIIILYSNDTQEQHGLIESCINKGYDVVELGHIIDNHFMQQLEHKGGEVTFVRVDSDTIDNLIQKDETQESVLSEDENTKVKELFEAVAKSGGGYVQVKPLSPSDPPVIVTKPEFMRRMKEMQMMQGMQMGDFPESFNVTINANHPIIAQKIAKSEEAESTNEMAQHLYDIALLSQNMLKGEQLTNFVKRSIDKLG